MALRDLLQVQELDFQVRGIQDQRNELRDELRILEQGGMRNGVHHSNATQERINEIFNELSSLDVQMQQIMSAQNEAAQNTDLAFQMLLPNLLNLLYTGEEDAAFLFNQALSSAIQGMITTNELGNASVQIDGHRSSLFDQLHTIQNGLTPQDIEDTISQIRRNIQDTDRQMQNLRLQQDQVKLARENTLRESIVLISEIEASITIARSDIALLEKGIISTTALHEFGFTSMSDIRLAEQTLAQTQMELNALYLRRYDAMRTLNHMIGEPLSQFTIIEFEIITPILPENLTKHIERIVLESPIIQQLQLDIDRAYEERRIYTANGRNTQRSHSENNRDRSRQNELAEAYALTIITRDQAQLALEVALRQGFNNLEQLITQAETLRIEHEAAKDTLHATQFNFELGRVIQYDVDQALIAISRVEKNLEVISSQKWLLAFLLDNPFLLLV